MVQVRYSSYEQKFVYHQLVLGYFCSKWGLATLVYFWRELLPLATKVT
jgi:hypothetical protein